ncbi:hypothetical protein [Phaeacidiphilus oryzae]|uniref:hypothetical protein n=1 Tax=Phaeacidiphilus oryzae TaxID=348818 RepID=UPI0005645532|nr:hypothetical protein [Phaeacidiphilus oryzae]
MPGHTPPAVCRAAAVVAAALLPVVLAGCGGGSSKQSQPLAAAMLNRAALAVGDMPSGFVPDPTGGAAGMPATTDPTCGRLLAAVERPGTGGDVHAHSGTSAFRRSPLGPWVRNFAQSATGDGAKSALSSLGDLTGKCGGFTGTLAGRRISFKVGDLPLASMGDESKAVRMTGTLSGQPVEADFVAIRVGSNLTVVGHSDIGWNAADTTITKQAAQRAAEKLKQAAGGTTPTPSPPAPAAATGS